MHRVTRVVFYSIGIVSITVGVLFISEFLLKAITDYKVHYINSYPIIGGALVVIGTILCFWAYRFGRNTRPQV
jgi:hypothetical protein